MCARRNVVFPRSMVAWYAFMMAVTGAFCVTLIQERVSPRIVPKFYRELEPLELTCDLTDMVIIAAPMVPGGDSQYYLTRPNGMVTKLDIQLPKEPDDYESAEYHIQFSEHPSSVVVTKGYKYKVFNANYGCSINSSDIVGEKLQDLTTNEFIIGPLEEKDHGEWLLTIYNNDNNSDWLEISLKISVKISERIDLDTVRLMLHEGRDFAIGFPYPIPDITKCELVVPASSITQFYKGSKMDLHTCRYEVTNITKQDGGFWRIIGYGNILHLGTLYVQIQKDNATAVRGPAPIITEYGRTT